MSVVIIGGNECMSRKYTDICQEHGCKAKVFAKENGPIRKKIGTGYGITKSKLEYADVAEAAARRSLPFRGITISNP